MPITVLKPLTPGRRKISVLKDLEIAKKAEPPKSLRLPKKQKAGRNNQGKITVRHRGGGEKRFLRKIDFKRSIRDIEGVVERIEYDPNRSANIALVKYNDNLKAYILAPQGLKVGDKVISADKAKIAVGNHMMLKNMPVGTVIHNLEITPGKGGALIRSAGESGVLLGLEDKYATIKLPSGEIRKVLAECRATVGAVGREEWSNVRIGKAGRMRHMGRRPTVRGKAMNPVDHPHGGGEGVAPIGLKHPKTPWGAPALGRKTRRPKASDKLILSRRK